METEEYQFDEEEKAGGFSSVAWGRGESRLRGLCEEGSKQVGKADLPD